VTKFDDSTSSQFRKIGRRIVIAFEVARPATVGLEITRIGLPIPAFLLVCA
jgi:hypothetical protein